MVDADTSGNCAFLAPCLLWSSSAVTGSALGSGVEICRDPLGIPHIFASSEKDYFFGLGYACAEDPNLQMGPGPPPGSRPPGRGVRSGIGGLRPRGFPGIFVGFNRRIAWRGSARGADAIAIFLDRLPPDAKGYAFKTKPFLSKDGSS
jgi:acyl-homoserine lactone acylase PvdQ